MSAREKTPITPDQLSAYLDGELSKSEARALERRLENDAEGRERLEGMRGVVDGLRGLEPISPPPTLDHMVARQIALEKDRRGMLDQLEARLDVLNRHNPMLALFGVVIALGLFILMFSQALQRKKEAPTQVEWVFPDQSPDARARHIDGTRLELLDRVFFWAEDAWRERGIAQGATEQLIDLATPEGRAWLAEHPDLAVLEGADDPVVLVVGGDIVRVRPATSDDLP